MVELPKFSIKVPKPNYKSLDWSKLNFRKFNLTTILALLSYLSVLIFIPMLVQSPRTFVQYHVRQGIALLGVWVLFVFSFFVPGLPYLFAIYIVIATVIAISNVLRDKEQPLPIIGKLAL
jgi:uncharacterized membrane protein